MDSLAARLFQLFGRDLLDALTVVEGGNDAARVRGLVSRLGVGGPVRPNLRLYVNGRPIRDRALARAVAQGYQAAGGGERGFEAFLFLDVPLHLVDVNVHPAKSEVRFSDARGVWSVVEHAVAAGLSQAAREAAPVALKGQAERVAEAVALYTAEGEAPPSEQSRFAWGRGAAGPSAPVPEEEVARAALFPHGPPSVLGQHRNTYIVLSDGQDLILVDQHTAHERARFERLQERVSARAVESQLLLAPAVATLPPALFALFEEHAQALRDLGFDAEPFGGGTLRVRALPGALGTRDPGPALQALLQDFLERDSAEWTVVGARDRLAATLACHSSVRAGQPLQAESMQAIVRELSACQHPTLCPHGRPTIVRVPGGDVSRWFGRVGWRRS